MLEHLDKRGIQANIPFRTTHVNVRKKREDAGFHYDEELNAWVCPKGKPMRKRQHKNSAGHIGYINDPKECVGCPKRETVCKTRHIIITDS